MANLNDPSSNNFLYLLNNKIKIIGIENVLSEFDNEFNNKYNKIYEKVGISVSSYKNYFRLYKNPPLWFLRKLALIDKDVLNKCFKRRINYTARINIIHLPRKIDSKLAYFIGYLHGDGFIGSDGKTYGFTDEYLDHILYIKKLNKELFNSDGKIVTKRSKIGTKNYYHLEVRSFVVNNYLNKVFLMPKGIKNYIFIPKIIKYNKNLLRWYLRGLFDADGTLPKHPHKAKQLFIDISLKNKNMIFEIKKLLKSEFDIETLKPYPRISKSPHTERTNITWELRIRRRGQIKRFLKQVGFFHFEKKRRARAMLELLMPA